MIINNFKFDIFQGSLSREVQQVSAHTRNSKGNLVRPYGTHERINFKAKFHDKDEALFLESLIYGETDSFTFDGILLSKKGLAPNNVSNYTNYTGASLSAASPFSPGHLQTTGFLDFNFHEDYPYKSVTYWVYDGSGTVSDISNWNHRAESLAGLEMQDGVDASYSGILYSTGLSFNTGRFSNVKLYARNISASFAAADYEADKISLVNPVEPKLNVESEYATRGKYVGLSAEVVPMKVHGKQLYSVDASMISVDLK